MLKNIFIGFLLFSIMALPNIVLSQDCAKGKWWLSPRMSEQLNLTDEEKNKLDEQYVENRRKLIDLKSSVEKERLELDTLLDVDPIDEGAIKTQFKKLENARSNLSQERFNFIIKSRKILGKERFQQIKQSYKKHRRDRQRSK